MAVPQWHCVLLNAHTLIMMIFFVVDDDEYDNECNDDDYDDGDQSYSDFVVVVVQNYTHLK